jgi:hypothetical protein
VDGEKYGSVVIIPEHSNHAHMLNATMLTVRVAALNAAANKLEYFNVLNVGKP